MIRENMFTSLFELIENKKKQRTRQEKTQHIERFVLQRQIESLLHVWIFNTTNYPEINAIPFMNIYKKRDFTDNYNSEFITSEM